MSERTFDEPERLGYFLPEDSQHRLKKLYGNLRLLARLARPHSPDEEQRMDADVYSGDLATCLELLMEQVETVLDEVWWPATWLASANDAERDAVLDTAPQARGSADERLAFGITADQIDALDRLIETLVADADAAETSLAAKTADPARPHSKQAIHAAVMAVQAILDQVRAQRLERGGRPDDRVRELPAIYAVDVGAMSIGNRGPGAISLLSTRDGYDEGVRDRAILHGPTERRGRVSMARQK